MAGDYTLDQRQVERLLGFVVAHLCMGPSLTAVTALTDAIGAAENYVPEILGLREGPCGCTGQMVCSDWDCPGGNG